MKTRSNATLGRRELDRRLRRVVAQDLVPPRVGWMRAIRDALVMSQAQLGRRLGISASAVHQLEHAEQLGGITLGKLEQVANALECRLVYAIVPFDSLDETVHRQARAAAAAELGYVNRTMALESQSVMSESESDILESVAQRLIESGRAWDRQSAEKG